MNSTLYQPGDRVTVGPYECEVERQFDDKHPVYLCRVASQAEPVVLKYLHFSHSGRNMSFPNFRSRLGQRATALFQNVRDSLLTAGIPDMMFCDDTHHLVGYVPGKSLDGFTDYSLQEVQDIMLRTSATIGVLMEHELVHGDVKMDNVIMSLNNNQPVSTATTLIDFGLMGKAGEWSDPRGNRTIGTPYYMAPEQALGGYEYTTDVFSAGLLALDILHKSPYDIDFFSVVQDQENLRWLLQDRIFDLWRLPNAKAYLESRLLTRDDVDVRSARAMIDFIFACTEHAPEARPQSGEEMRQMLTDTGNVTEI